MNDVIRTLIFFTAMVVAGLVLYAGLAKGQTTTDHPTTTLETYRPAPAPPKWTAPGKFIEEYQCNCGPNSSVFNPPPQNPQTQSIHPAK